MSGTVNVDTSGDGQEVSRYLLRAHYGLDSASGTEESGVGDIEQANRK